MAVTDAIPEMKRDSRFFAVETQNPKKLTVEQIDNYNKQGYVFPIDLFTEEEIVANRAYFNSLLNMATKAGLDSYGINGWHTHSEGLYDLVTDNRILDYVEDIIGPNIVCTMTHYFSKPSGDVKSVYWHQDASFWPITPSKVVTVWIAIDDVDEENGAMKVFPGTHLLGTIPFEWVTDKEDGVLNQHVRNPEQFGEPVSVALKAGQLSLHTDLLLHGSMPNPSTRRRCGLTIRYFPVDVRGTAKDHMPAVLARGEDPLDYWQPQKRPTGETIPPSA